MKRHSRAFLLVLVTASVLATANLALAQTPAPPSGERPTPSAEPATPSTGAAAPVPPAATNAPAPSDPAALPVATVSPGATVKIEYTIKDDRGNVIDTNRGETPLSYRHGQRQLVPGLENALNGMHVGDTKSVKVLPEDGYGPVLPEAQTEVPRSMIPGDSLEVGAELIARSSTGERLVRVKEVRDNTVVLDLNHPLAGRTLYVDVRVVDIDNEQKP